MKRKNGIYKYILNIVLLFSSLFVYSCNKVDIDYKYVDVFLFVGDGLISGIGESEDVIKCDNAYEYDSNGLRLLNNKNGGLKGVTIRENRRRRIACACFLAFLR